MIKQLLLLSGSIAAGKSTLADTLLKFHGYERVSSGSYLRARAEDRGLSPDRSTLQQLGDQLDAETDFSWIVDEVAAPALAKGTHAYWLVDAVRKRRQAEHFKSRFERVVHVHVWAPESILRERYLQRHALTGGSLTDAIAEYDRAVLHPNEIESRSLADVSDLRFDTSSMTIDEIVLAITSN